MYKHPQSSWTWAPTPPSPLKHSHLEPSGVSRCSANASSASIWLRLVPETSSVSNVPKKLGHESTGPDRRAQVIPWREKEARDTETRATSAAEGRVAAGTTHICRVYSAFIVDKPFHIHASGNPVASWEEPQFQIQDPEAAIVCHLSWLHVACSETRSPSGRQLPGLFGCRMIGRVRRSLSYKFTHGNGWPLF